jgi:hypothetical protein
VPINAFTRYIITVSAPLPFPLVQGCIVDVLFPANYVLQGFCSDNTNILTYYD